MWIPRRLGEMATQLREGRRVNRITVRDLLRIFNAERRGLNVTQEIRAALDSQGLETDPDFESAWIDGPIRIQLKKAGSDGDVSPGAEPGGAAAGVDGDQDDDAAQPGEPTTQPAPEIVISGPAQGVVETRVGEQGDPTFRIGSLPAANAQLETVAHDDPLARAITKMLTFDYSQLPIMRSEREVQGVISLRSIAARQAICGECSKVHHCREDVQIVDANGTLFDAIPTIVAHGYVLVRGAQNRITGIVTASDLSLQFRQLAEPFLLLREVELHLRQVLDGAVGPAELAACGRPGALPAPAAITDLSFGDYIRLLRQQSVWEKLGLSVDQGVLTSQLDQVRLIRNDVMHFDPDPITPAQMQRLKNAAGFLRRVYELQRKSG
jgi:hypothetical protein